MKENCAICKHHDVFWEGSGCNLLNHFEKCRFEMRLKPCPFCGGRAFLNHTNQPIGDSYQVYCGNEDCTVEPCTHTYFEKNQAVEAWNRRCQL